MKEYSVSKNGSRKKTQRDDFPEKGSLLISNSPETYPSQKDMEIDFFIDGPREDIVEEKITEDVLQVFKKSTKKDYLKTINELSKATNVEIQDLYKVLENNYKVFCRNRKGKFTTRELYQKHTPFLWRLASILDGRVI